VGSRTLTFGQRCASTVVDTLGEHDGVAPICSRYSARPLRVSGCQHGLCAQLLTPTRSTCSKPPWLPPFRLSCQCPPLGDDPRRPDANVKKLTGYEDRYRLRVGDYRVIYDVTDKQLLILVVGVGHRREIYRAIS
jgi:mRNA interferase RelE/StbE